MMNRNLVLGEVCDQSFIPFFVLTLYIVCDAGIRKSKAGRDEAKVKAALAKLTASAALSADEGNNNKV